MEEIDIKQMFQAIWNKKLLVVVITIIMIVLAAVYSFAIQKPKFKSSTTIVLTKIKNTEEGEETAALTATDITMNQKLIETYSEIIKSENVLGQVIKNLNLTSMTFSELKSNITVKALSDTSIINITVIAYDAEEAAKIANEIGEVFSEWVKANLDLDNVRILDVAKSATSPYNIQPKKYIAIAAVMGIIISCAYIVVREQFDSTIKTTEEIETLLDLPVIAKISNATVYVKGGNK